MVKTSITFSDPDRNGTTKPDSLGLRNDFEDEASSPIDDTRKEENVNDFMRKKTLAQGFLDFALLAANAAQLKRILSAGSGHSHYSFLVTLISISIALQLVQAVLMSILGIFLDMNIKKSHPKQIITNNLLLMSTALCVGVNVLVSAFDMAEIK